MDLKTFVSESLTQIVEGVVDARERIEALRGMVNPPGIQSSESDRSYAPYAVIKAEKGRAACRLPIQEVKFDVAVTASSDAQTKAGAGLLSVVSAGISKEKGAKDETTSRIRFRVPLALPLHPTISEGLGPPRLPDPQPQPHPSS